jgi:hypothetical protein
MLWVLSTLRAFGAVSCLWSGSMASVLTDIWFESTFLHFSLKILFFFLPLKLSQLSISIVFVSHHSLLGLISNLSLSLFLRVVWWLLFRKWGTVTLGTVHKSTVLVFEIVVIIQSPFSRFGFSIQISLSGILVKSQNLWRIHGFITYVWVIKLVSVTSETIIDLNVCDWVSIELLWSLRVESSLGSILIHSGHTFIKIIKFSIIADAWFSELRPQIRPLLRQLSVTPCRLWAVSIALVVSEVVFLFVHVLTSHYPLFHGIRFSVF